MKQAILICALVAPAAIAQSTITGSKTMQGSWDASGASATKPAKSGATLPSTCKTGEFFFNTAAAAGQNLYLCDPDNTWTQGSSGVGAGLTAGKIAQAASSSSLTDSNLAQDATTGQLTASKSISGPAASAGAATGAITIDTATCQRCEVPTLTGNITGVSFTHLKPGLKFSMVFTQAATGGPYNVTYGSSVVANTACSISSGAGIVTTQDFEVASDGATVWGKGCPSSDVATEIAGPERTENTTSTSGTGQIDFSSSRHTPTYYGNASGNAHIMPRTSGSTDQLASTDLSDSSGLVRTIASGTLALPTSSLPSGACTTATTTATGATASDIVNWSPSASWKAIAGYSGTSGILTVYPGVATTNQINIDVCNWTGSTISTIGAASVKWAVRR